MMIGAGLLTLALFCLIGGWFLGRAALAFRKAGRTLEMVLCGIGLAACVFAGVCVLAPVDAEIRWAALGVAALTVGWPIGRSALVAARSGSRSRTLVFGVGAAFLALAGLAALAEAMVRLFQS